VGSIEYLVPAWVRVRREDFGLLFYDTRSTRLTFVRSGDSLEPPPFTGARRTLHVRRRDVDGSAPPADPRSLARLLDDLAAKGLIVAAEAE
jgi:putative mycofactocin binding protein MftB